MYLRKGWFLLLVLGLAGTVIAGVPRTEDEVKARVEELRKEYEPYLRSLPKPLNARSRQELRSKWVSKYEVDNAPKGATKPDAPEWFGVKFNDSGWEPTTVPEWRYKEKSRRHAASSILWYRTKFNAELPEKGKRTFLVFEGVEWEAEAWLNDKFLGSHKVYYEPFRFDVTDVLKKENTLAVRVIAGPEFGQPGVFEPIFPQPPADEQRYVRDKSKSIPGYKTGQMFLGTGIGIHRDVYLETTGPACIGYVLARGYHDDRECAVKVEFDSAGLRKAKLSVEIMPENFEGESCTVSKDVKAGKGFNMETITLSIPGKKVWSPDAPYLYRCRVRVEDDGKLVDAKDVLFGCRTFEIASKLNPKEGFKNGMPFLNGEPLYVRGSNEHGFNALWYWGEMDKVKEFLLMFKAANFNAMRATQHTQYPEIRELMDRLGVMSEQEQGVMYPQRGEQTWDDAVYAAGILPKVTYNNPGVILNRYANETYFDPAEIIKASIAVDPERVIVHGAQDWSGYKMTDELWAHCIDNFHTYKGWYGRRGQIETLFMFYEKGRMTMNGEYGSEGLDSYETLQNYPKHWGEIPKTDQDVSEEVLRRFCVQTKKDDARQVCGFRGEIPSNFGEYIEASQTYQADQVSEHTKSFRLSQKSMAGYFHYRFEDVLAANWPKSIVSFDLRPKKAYYEMAQLNQPIVPLPVFVDEGQAMEIWVSNYTGRKYDNCFIDWEVKAGNKTYTSDQANASVPAYDAKMLTKVRLKDVPEDVKVVKVSLVLYDSTGPEFGQYQREVYIGAWRK